MTKKEAIAEAYGIFYNPETIHYSINGWIGNENKNVIDKMIKNGILLEFGKTRVRPLSLLGIEDNNGWIKIQSENDLPKNQIRCITGLMYNKNNFIYGFEEEKTPEVLKDLWELNEITHYKPIEKQKQPIY